jgi:hypothetical protein
MLCSLSTSRISPETWCVSSLILIGSPVCTVSEKFLRKRCTGYRVVNSPETWCVPHTLSRGISFCPWMFSPFSYSLTNIRSRSSELLVNNVRYLRQAVETHLSLVLLSDRRWLRKMVKREPTYADILFTRSALSKVGAYIAATVSILLTLSGTLPAVLGSAVAILFSGFILHSLTPAEEEI